MAYLAMARKWRPKNFEEMVGQDHIAQTIRNAIEGKRISHAYLFTGTRGVGKTTSARILAKALNCSKGPTPIPCDTCENCKAVNAGNSMDVLEIDGASNNGVDNIRELREQVNYAPMHGTYKIYVIDEVHMLSKSAFNALLKTLEEPPPHVVFIFATTEAGKLPHTILSRVQRFDFKRISEANIRERLEFICSKEAITPEREALEAIARKADGSMRDALSLFDQVYAFSGADLTLEAARKVLGLPREGLFDGLLTALIKHDQKACFTAIQEAHSEGIETSDLLVAFGEYCRNLLFSRQGVSATALGLSENRYRELSIMAPELRDGDLIRFAKMISDMLAQIKTSPNPRLAIELGFARMASLDRVVTLSQLLGQDFTSSGPVASPIDTETHAVAEVKKKNPVESISSVTAGGAPVTAGGTPVTAGGAPVTAGAFTQSPVYTQAMATSNLASASTVLLAELDALEPGTETAFPEPILDAPVAIEEDLDSQMENAYDGDSDEADGTGIGDYSPATSAISPEEVEVPSQASVTMLPELWPRLLGEFISSRPLLGSHLLKTRLDWTLEETPRLRVVFLEKSSFLMIENDADFRKAIQAFLHTKVIGSVDFPVHFHFDEIAATSDSKESVQLLYGSDDPMKIPIVGFIRDLFEGRQIN
jgi:DNA polymerase III subunit gamma/tau